MDTEQGNLSTELALSVLRRRGLWILLCFVLVTAALYGYSKQQTKKYTATAALSFSNNPLDQQIAGLAASGGASNLLAQQASNRETVQLGDIAVKTANLLGHGLTGEAVRASLSISAQGETSIVNVAATSSSPRLAAAIANTYASQFVKEQQSSNRNFFKSALALVKKQLAKLSAVQRVGPDGLDLQERAHTLGLLAELGYNNAQVAQEALVPSSPSSPRTKRNTILGAIVGLLLGLLVAALLEHFDRRIRRLETLEEIYRLPMLGVVPKSGAFSRSVRDSGGKEVALPAAEAEAFGLIRAHLRFFNVNRDVRTLVIASPAPGDGKSVIARHLAETAARAGARVLLLEVDMRRPTLAQQLQVRARPGLSEVLIGAASMREVTQSVELQTPPGEWATTRTLDVLVAGTSPPNPGELLESRAMDTVLAQAKSTYDFVVIDTPPLTAVSDAFPLLTKVDGVVIVGWIGRSRRDAAQELQQILAGSGAPLLGVIANGAKSSGLGSYADPPSVEKSSPAGSSANGASSTERLVPTSRD